MCDYLSFCGDLNGEQFWFEPNLMSHSNTANLHLLVADRFREFEWKNDDAGESLVVRVHADDPHDSSWLRACVLAKWPTRKALEEWLIVNIPQSRIQKRFVKGGYGSTLTGGDRSTLTGGDRSTLTGGDDSTLTGGDDSVLAILELDSGYKWIRHVAIVGKDNIKPNVPYRVVRGKFTEMPQPKEAGK